MFSLGRRSRSATSRFVTAEAGSFTVLSLFLIILMLIAGGAAVDFMRHESTRARLQSTLDRAILASASLDQTLDPELVVADYFAKSGLSGYHLVVDPDSGGDQYRRRVAASVQTDVPSFFLRFVGIDSLVAPARGAAEESNSTIEISLVLDISTSMNSVSTSGKRKIQELRDAATAFVAKIHNQADTTRTTISIIPYATQVNVGPALLDQFNHSRTHGYSACVDFADTDFSSAVITPLQPLQQAGHFDRASNRNTAPWQWVCNNEKFSQILPVSGSKQELTDYIAALRVLSYTGYTSTENGVKWGAALLLPQAQPVIEALTGVDAATGQRVAEAFGNRPLALGSSAQKILIVMTDGDNTNQWFLANAYRTGLSNVWKNSTTGALSVNPTRTNGLVQQTWPEVWAQMSMQDYAYRMGRNASTYHWSNGVGVKDAYTRSICTSVKDLGVRVYTIGFEIAQNSNAHVLMRDCASSVAYFYPVNGSGIQTAFDSIANDIGKLRLTQ